MNIVVLTFLLAGCCVVLGWLLRGGDQNEQTELLEEIIMKVNELPAKFDALTTQVGKIATEVTALKDALTNVDLPPEAVAALERLETAVKGVDDLNEDAPTPA